MALRHLNIKARVAYQAQLKFARMFELKMRSKRLPRVERTDYMTGISGLYNGKNENVIIYSNFEKERDLFVKKYKSRGYAYKKYDRFTQLQQTKC